MQGLGDGPLPDRVLRLGTYYDAAAFVDVVYRVYRYLEGHPEAIPPYSLGVVDELQDFTRLEVAFIRLLGRASPLLVAGDDDQALYPGRFASADFIRELAQSGEAERHELPFCSRCPQPVVDAVNSTIERATATGRLADRLEKPFRCYLPDKADVSEAHPDIINARCTKWGAIPQYVAAEIAKISPPDIETSRKGGHATALVLGPKHVVEAVFEYLKAGPYPDAEFPHSEQFSIEPIDAYRRLARDPRSNLGWRLLVYLSPFAGWEDAIRGAFEHAEPLVDRIPAAYRDAALEIAELVGIAIGGQRPEGSHRPRLVLALDVADEELDGLLLGPPETLADEGDEIEDGSRVSGVAEETTANTPGPTILCTTLQGAKGLAAEHVFVVGLMHKHFPNDNASPTDEEVCEFLVALSRTRTACHLVSCERMGRPPRPGRPQPLAPVSVFVEWVAPHSREVRITAGDVRPRSG